MTGNETILQYLTNVPAWYLATSVNDQPHVRPFSFAAEQDGKIWFVTATTKDVWEELRQNQKFEASSWPVLRTRPTPTCATPATLTCAAWARATTAPTTPRWCSSASKSPRHGSATTRSGSRSSCSDICI